MTATMTATMTTTTAMMRAMYNLNGKRLDDKKEDVDFEKVVNRCDYERELIFEKLSTAFFEEITLLTISH